MFATRDFADHYTSYISLSMSFNGEKQNVQSPHTQGPCSVRCEDCICGFAGKPEVKWLANGKLVKDCEDFRYQNAGDVHKLIIGEIFPEDSGMYTCTATNAGGTASSSCTVFVKGTESMYNNNLLLQLFAK